MPLAYLKTSVRITVLGFLLQSMSVSASLSTEKETQPPYTLTNILTATETITGQKLKLPKKKAKVIVTRISIAPGAIYPIHKHAFQRYNYVISGTLQITHVETHKSIVYKTGSFIPETYNSLHYATNIGKDTLELLAIDQVPEKAESNTIFQDK